MENNTPASAKADNPELKPKDVADSGPAYPNKLNNPAGAGSPYAGTQSKDPQAPDGLQQPKEQDTDSDAAPETTGDEYATGDSYGHKGAADNRETPGSEHREEGSPAR